MSGVTATTATRARSTFISAACDRSSVNAAIVLKQSSASAIVSSVVPGLAPRAHDMSRRNAYLLVAFIIFLALFLLLPSLTARVSLLLLLIGAVLLVKTLTQPSTEKLEATDAVADVANKESSQEIFALGKLFEATMNGMREGLLVVDKDMRVVASNIAAHRLFNPSAGKLDAQRLTELTRNPAIYSAFLDALKGTER